MKTSRFNFSQLLDFKKADYGDTLQAGQYPDDRITLQYRLPYGAAHEAKEWVYANYHVLRDVELPHMLLQGVWRTVALVTKPIDPDSEKEGQFLQWTIAKGLYTEIDWTSARMAGERSTTGNSTTAGVPNSASDNVAKDVVIEFPYCDPDKIDAMASSLAPATVADITVRGEVIAGPWHLISTSTRREEDGTHTIVASCSRSSFVLEGHQDLGGTREATVFYLWRIPKDEAQGIQAAWKVAHPKGSSCTFSFSEEQGFVDIVLRKKAAPVSEADGGVSGLSCSYVETATYYFNQTSSAAVDISAYPTTPGISWRRSVENNGDGTFDIVVVKRLRKVQGPQLFTSEISKGLTTTSRETRGWITGYAAYDALYPSTLPTVGTTLTRDVSINEDCSLDIVDRTTVVSELTRVSKRATILAESLSTGGVNRQPADVAADAAVVPAQGETLTFDAQENKDGTKNSDLRIDVSPVLDNYEKTATILSASEGTGVENKRDPMPTPTAATIGKTVRFRRSRNPDGTYTYNEIIEDSALNPLRARTFEVTMCRGSENEAVVERNIASDLFTYEPDDPPQGTIRVVRLTENRDGSWDREIQDRTAPELTSTENVVRSKGGVVVTITRNQTGAKPGLPSVEQGVTKTQRIDDNPDCGFDVTLREETAANLVIEIKEFAADRTVITTAASAATSPVTLAAESGKVISGRNDEQLDGTWRTEKREETPVPTSTGWVPYTDKYGTSYFIAFSNQTASGLDIIKSACTADTNNSISASVNRYGLYDGGGTRIAISDGGGGGGGSGGSETKDYDVTFDVSYQGITYTVRQGVDNSRANAEQIVEDGQVHPIIPRYEHGMRQVAGKKWYFCSVIKKV